MEESRNEETVPPRYLSAGATHTGLARATNQDAFVDRAAVHLWAVADGMGGHRDGDVASRMVCDALEGYEGARTLEAGIDDVRQRMNEVNQRLYAAAVRPVDPIQSGSTVVMLLIKDSACAVLWAGDSRVYRLREGQLAQLTRDHTWASQFNLEELPGAEADHSITRAVGGEYTLLLDVYRDRVRPGDRYLLCSDGLTREVSAPQIAVLLGKGDAQTSTAALIRATLRAGAHDNVTVVVVDAT
ncbi:MAG: protein phosphatase 2C domain-containing protein [Steroidobacteraceae bacterium]